MTTVRARGTLLGYAAIAGAIAASCVTLAAVLPAASEAAGPPPLTAGSAAREQYWAGRIERVGPTRAYSEFSRAVAPLPPDVQHLNAHAFGGALYEVAGTAGLSTCDAQFSFGCFHEFLGRAIATEGFGIVNALDETCVKTLGPASLSCEHGIGHGIAAAAGYDLPALKQALAVCASLPRNDPLEGCYGGVFMEYNVQTMLGSEGRVRPEEPGAPYDPCHSVPEVYASACAFWQPQWWVARARQDAPEKTPDYAAIGARCDGIGGALLVRRCYEGFGTIVPVEAGFDPAAAARVCETSSADPVHALFCKSYAANSITVGGGELASGGTAVCAGLEGEAYDYCMSYATNHSSLADELPAP
jgi:hypothetical protein